MFLSVNMTVFEFIELTNDYNNRLTLQRMDLADIKEYIILNMDPDRTLKESCFLRISEKFYMNQENKTINEYLESLDGYDGSDVISVPIYTVNFLKQFANKKNKSFILAYIKNIISIANDLNKVYHVKNYKDVDFKTLCNDFGYDTNWNLLK